MILLVILFVIIILVYLYNVRTFNYWKKKAIKHDKPVIFFGTYTKEYLLMRSTTQALEDIYWKYPDERVVGCFRSITPELMIRDPELVKRILLSDFNHFQSRALFKINDDVYEPLEKHLFNVDGDLWRLLRQRMSPAFTSGKLKAMFPLIVERAERLKSRIRASAGAPIDARDLMARFTTEFIGACAFGLDIDVLSDESSKFREIGIKIFKVTPRIAVKKILREIFPNMFKRFRMIEKDVGEAILYLVQTAFKQRNYEPSGRNDFIDLMLECKKKGEMVGESTQKLKPDGTREEISLELTDDLIAAQVFVFFAAGFETSSSTTSFTLHLLAYHPEKQKKVQDEIDRVLSLHDNKLSYYSIKDMTYLEWAFNESMRIFPAIGFLSRKCTRKYKFIDMDLTIDEGVKIIIPLQAMHNDPKYFENPKEFRPERFDPKEMDSAKTKFVYMPFGEGPRSCVAERLGQMQSLAGLAAVLSRFTVEPAPSSVRYPEIDKVPSVLQSIKAGLPLIFKERKKDL